MKEKVMADKYKVKQVKSSIGETGRVVDTLAALGLGKIGREKIVLNNPAVKGMIRKVKHLVYVIEA